MPPRRLAACLAAFCALLTAAAAAALEAGDEAPDFVLQGSDGQSYALSRFLGKGGVVLAWFPKAFTPG